MLQVIVHLAWSCALANCTYLWIQRTPLVAANLLFSLDRVTRIMPIAHLPRSFPPAHRSQDSYRFLQPAPSFPGTYNIEVREVRLSHSAWQSASPPPTRRMANGLFQCKISWCDRIRQDFAVPILIHSSGARKTFLLSYYFAANIYFAGRTLGSIYFNGAMSAYRFGYRK